MYDSACYVRILWRRFFATLFINILWYFYHNVHIILYIHIYYIIYNIHILHTKLLFTISQWPTRDYYFRDFFVFVCCIFLFRVQYLTIRIHDSLVFFYLLFTHISVYLYIINNFYIYICRFWNRNRHTNNFYYTLVC